MPTCSSSSSALPVEVIGYASSAAAPRARACSTAAAASAVATPCLRTPSRTSTQVTAHTLESCRSSSRFAQAGRELLRTSPSYAGRGSTAHHPAGSPSTYATSPLVGPGPPQSACCAAGAPAPPADGA